MTRTTLLRGLLAGILLTTPTFVFAQAPAAPAASESWLDGSAKLMLLGRDDVASSRFEEYQVIPKGVSMPIFALEGEGKGSRFGLFGSNVSQADQRYVAFVDHGWFSVAADYNQIQHNIGYDGRTLANETGPGVWQMSATLRQALQTTYDNTPAATRTYPWLLDFWGPTLDAAPYVDVRLQRNRGTYTMALGSRDLGLTLRYLREHRTGAKDTTPVYVSSQILEVPTPTDYLTQDFGATGVVARKWGNVHAGFNYDWFKNAIDVLYVDNPLRATDAAYVNPIGGPAFGHNVMAPDNQAYNVSAGGQLNFARQTRVYADVVKGKFTQDDAFFPYTFNTTVFTTAGLPAWLTSSLPATSLGGEIDTTTLSFVFTSRPADPLQITARFRSYDFDNNTPAITTPGYVSWDRSWSNGAVISVPYGYKTQRFQVTAGYSITKPFSVEASFRHGSDDRTFREAETTTEDAFGASAIAHFGSGNVRAVVETSSRAAEALETGAAPSELQYDLAERDGTKVGAQLELTPVDPVTIGVAFFNRKDDYDGTWGYQEYKYNTVSGDLDIQANDRTTLTLFYTYELNRDGQRGYQTISGVREFHTAMLEDKANAVGANVRYTFVPTKWEGSLFYRYEKVDGLADLGGSAAIEATRAGNGGIQDIPNSDDTTFTIARAELAYTPASAWTVSAGIWYQDYKYSDASVRPGEFFPAAGVFSLAPNYGSYSATMGYVTLSYRF